ncbi:MAG: UDP-N-acetylglucosamine 1-carboxyvinyltransferase [Clostridia bacterium]|nr:UDP-N-acetylglucosamine 1-carboxyvinyltransferase [Clostridia bacterium]
MSEYIIEGGNRLYGECGVQGAKNSALPILAATLLCEGKSDIYNCPELLDVDATANILMHLGCVVSRSGHRVTVCADSASGTEIPEPLMREMRSSVIFLGAILARNKRVRLSTPGGCEIGLRPIDLHLDAMRKLGAVVSEEYGNIECTAPDGLKGATVSLSFPSVGATENIIIAASTAKGTTTVINAAREPEISDLADFLNGCGAKISGAGQGTVVIEGVKRLNGSSHSVITDRIAAATYMAAAAATGGNVRLVNIIPAHIGPMIDLFEEAGCKIRTDCRSVNIEAPKLLKSVKMIRTMPYPGFPTDIQAPIGAMLTKAKGTSVIIETIFENRFKYIGELIRFGAKIRADGRMAVIEGVPVLHGARVRTTDLRGGAALIVAGLASEGETVITDIKHIERGYESPEKTLAALSGKIRRIDNDGSEKSD